MVGMFRRSTLTILAAGSVLSLALLSQTCRPHVTVETTAPGGSAAGSGGQLVGAGGVSIATGGAAAHGAGGQPGGSGQGASGVNPCNGTSQGCSSDQYPVGETCAECFCRCCNHPGDMDPCLASAECVAYITCVMSCANGPPCAAGCELPCDTGSEPACYLADCHNWMCEHACGVTY